MVLDKSQKEQIVWRVWAVEGSEALFYLLIHLIHCVVRSVTDTDSGWQRIQTIYRDPVGISMTDCHLLTEYWENRYRPLSPSQPRRWQRYLQILDSSSWQFSDIYCHITFSHTITIWGGCHIKTVYPAYFVIWLHLSLPHRRYVNTCDEHWRFRREN